MEMTQRSGQTRCVKAAVLRVRGFESHRHHYFLIISIIFPLHFYVLSEDYFFSRQNNLLFNFLVVILSAILTETKVALLSENLCILYCDGLIKQQKNVSFIHLLWQMLKKSWQFILVLSKSFSTELYKKNKKIHIVGKQKITQYGNSRIVFNFGTDIHYDATRLKINLRKTCQKSRNVNFLLFLFLKKLPQGNKKSTTERFELSHPYG